jgi:AraC-like DNA-binding protein
MTDRKRKYFIYDDKIVPMHFPRLLVEVAVEQGADGTALLERTCIDAAMFESSDARISLRQYALLIRNATKLTQNPALGIDLGRRVQPPNLGMLGLAAMGCPDVRTALDLGLQYHRLLMPTWDVSLEVKAELASLTFREVIPFFELHVYSTEVTLGAFNNLALTLIKRQVPVIEVKMDYARPDYAERYAEITRAPVLFDQPVTEVIIDAAFLQEKLPSPDPITVHAAKRQCEAALSSAVSSDSLIANVRRELCALPGRYPNPEELARVLQISERTLRRGLKEMGTSYQEMLDKARCEHAIQLLIGTGMSINEIAKHLGFSDSRSFRRAFKRWTGSTAAQYRKEKRMERVDGKQKNPSAS